jgi:hypothetical protein
MPPADIEVSFQVRPKETFSKKWSNRPGNRKRRARITPSWDDPLESGLSGHENFFFCFGTGIPFDGDRFSKT